MHVGKGLTMLGSEAAGPQADPDRSGVSIRGFPSDSVREVRAIATITRSKRVHRHVEDERVRYSETTGSTISSTGGG